MGDYELRYFMKDGGKRSGPHTVAMDGMPKNSLTFSFKIRAILALLVPR